MEWYIVLFILVISLSLFLFIGLPVAFSLGLMSMLSALVFWPGTTGLYGVALAGYGHMGNYTPCVRTPVHPHGPAGDAQPHGHGQL